MPAENIPEPVTLLRLRGPKSAAVLARVYGGGGVIGGRGVCEGVPLFLITTVMSFVVSGPWTSLLPLDSSATVQNTRPR